MTGMHVCILSTKSFFLDIYIYIIIWIGFGKFGSVDGISARGLPALIPDN